MSWAVGVVIWCLTPTKAWPFRVGHYIAKYRFPSSIAASELRIDYSSVCPNNVVTQYVIPVGKDSE